MATRQTKGNPPRPNGKPRAKPEEFQRFEDLTRKLTQVPKSELDAKRNGSKPPARSARRK